MLHPNRNRNTRTTQADALLHQQNIDGIGGLSVYQSFLLPSNSPLSFEFSLLFTLQDSSSQNIFSVGTDLFLYTENNNLILDYFIFTYTQRISIPIPPIFPKRVIIIKTKTNIRIYFENNLLYNKPFFYFPNPSNPNTLNSLADLKVYSTDIFLPLSPSLQEIDLLFANSPKETLILSSFSPDDKKGNCSIDFNKTWNPLKKIFQDCNIQIHSYLNNCTVRFWVNQFYSPSIFLTINNIYNLFVNKSSSRINGVEVDLNGTHLIEISVSTQILVYYDGNKIISNRNPSFGLYELNITNMDIWGLAIIQGVYSSQKHLVFKGVEETVYSNSFELDHIQYHNTALYPKYVNLLRQKEREEEIQPLIPKTINNIISNPTIYQTEKISNISVEGKTLSVSFIDYTNPYDRDQFIGLTNNFFSEIIKLKSVDTRQNIPFYSIVNNPLFVEGFYNGTIKGFATHPNLINTTKYKGFVKLDQNNNIDYLDSFEIRSFILVYKETELTPNRGYIGGQQNYVNGGSNGQIIGNIVIGLQDFSFVKSINTRSKDVSVSGKTIVVVDNANRVILVYRNLTLIQTIDPEQETLWDMGAVVKCVNEDRFLLGLKDGLFSNEGSVQIWDWNSTLSKFERRLYLNSPDSNQSGFGFSVDLRGNLLFVGQLGNQTTYVFQETNNIFSTTPIAVISGADTKVTETYIYCRNTLTNTITVYDNSYTELVRINNVNRFSANQEILVTVDLMNNTVTRYEDLVETETIIGINEFGFDVDINTHKQILVGSPEEGKIYLYSPSSLSNPVVISGSSFFGYSVSISEDYLLVSNFNNVVNIYSRDGTLIGDNVLSVFENGNPIEKNNLLDTNDWTVIGINLKNTALVDKIGKTQSGLYLNGFVQAFFSFSDILSPSQMKEFYIEIAKYLQIREYIPTV